MEKKLNNYAVCSDFQTETLSEIIVDIFQDGGGHAKIERTFLTLLIFIIQGSQHLVSRLRHFIWYMRCTRKSHVQ